MAKSKNGWSKVSGSGKRKIETAIAKGWRPGYPARWFYRTFKQKFDNIEG